MKIAIIDSGINPEYFHLCDEGYGLYNENLKKNENFYDTGLHGTLCAAIIKTIEPCSQICHIKIVNENGVSTGKMLLHALWELEKSEVKIINISLATRKKTLYEEMKKICKKLDNEGKIIFASAWNHSLEDAYPAALPNVIGVQGSKNRNHLCWKKGKYEVCINAEPELVNLNDNTMCFFRGTSKATAMASAICAKYLHQVGDMNREQFVKRIQKEPLKYDFANYSSKNSINIERIYLEIAQRLNISNDKLEKLLLEEYKDNPKKCIQLAEKLKEVYPNHKRIFLKDFESKASIINMINERWSN